MSNKDIVRKAIADAMRELLRQKDVEKITVTEICEKSQVNHRTFYRYFKDKHDIVDQIFSNDSLTKNIDKSETPFWVMFPYIARTLYADRHFYGHAFRYTGQNSFREYSISLLKPIIAKDYREGFPDEKSLNFFIEHACNASFDLFIIWLSAEPCMPPVEFVEYFKQCYRAFSKTTLDFIG